MLIEDKSQFKQTEVGLIPEDWEVLELGDVCRTVSDTYNFKDKDSIIFLNTGDIYDGKVLVHQPVSTHNLPGQAKKKIQKGDILYSEIRPANKRFAFVDFDANEYVVSTKLMVLRPEDKVDPKYLLIFLSGPEILNHFQVLAESRSGTFPQITFDTVKHTPIPFPQLPEQQKIAGVLGALDEKIELNRKMNKTLEYLGQAIFKRWFVDSEKYVEGKLSDIANVSTGKRPGMKSPEKTKAAMIPIIGASSVMGYTSKPLFNEKEIIVTGRVGTHGVLQRINYPCWPSDNTLIVTTKFPNFVYQTMCGLDFDSLNRGSTQPLITQTDLLNFPVYLPDTNKIEEYERKTLSIKKLIDNNEKQIDTLSRIRDSLLPRLMSGKLRVK